MKDNTVKKFTYYGIIFGLFFPIIAYAIDMWQKGLNVTVENITYMHTQTWVLYVIDMAPLILGGTAFFIGKYVSRKSKDIQNVLAEELEKSRKYSEFTEKLINGDYDFEIEIGDDEKSDELEESLEYLRDSLIKSEEREKRQNWTSNGLAKFIEVLRSDENNITVLADRIIANLVKYIEANQGAIFLLEKNDEGAEVLRLISAYAYEKKKFLEKSIRVGDGIIGAAVQENETVFLKEIPDDYIKISSGLGEARPSCVLIVPLEINEEVVGVIEVASFKLIEDYQQDFIQKLAENIAATVAGIRTSEMTSQLLNDSQMQTEQLRSQEEEMRQNMEEITATQEEMQRKEVEYQQRIEELEKQVENIK